MTVQLKHEVAVALGVLAAVGEAIVTTFPTGTVHDVLVIGLPIAAALGIRAQVMPMSKVEDLMTPPLGVPMATGEIVGQDPQPEITPAPATPAVPDPQTPDPQATQAMEAAPAAPPAVV